MNQPQPQRMALIALRHAKLNIAKLEHTPGIDPEGKLMLKIARIMTEGAEEMIARLQVFDFKALQNIRKETK